MAAQPGVVRPRDLLGTDPSDLMRELLQRAKLEVLYEAQQIGRREPSGASAGTLLYAAGVLRISDDELRPRLGEVASLIGPHGSVELPTEARLTVETNWTDGWCLLALLQRAGVYVDHRVRLLAESFLRRQESSGGWGLRPDRPGNPHPLFCVPAALALARLRVQGAASSHLVEPAIANLISYLRRPRVTDQPLVKILCEGLLRVLGNTERQAVLEELHATVWQGGELDFPSVEIGREDQPLWYTTIDRSLMLLATRRLWPTLDPVNVSLAAEILDSFVPAGGGWRNHPTDSSICTWRTAESLLAIELLCRDLARLGVTAEEWEKRRSTTERLNSTDGFDVGISFSSKQRETAVRIRKTLRDAGLTVFYDEDYQHELLGADLNVYLHDTYLRRCRFAVAVLSTDFVLSKWSGGLEWRAILARLQEARSDFLLPYYVEQVEVPGLSSAIGHLTAETHTPEQFAEVVVRKLLSTSRPPRGREA